MTIAELDIVVATIPGSADTLTLAWRDGTKSEYNSLWLRDNAPENRDPQNGQRLISIPDLPDAPRLSSAHNSPDGILVTWEDAYSATFSVAWLRAHHPSWRVRARPERLPWMSQPAATFHWSSYASWCADEAQRLRWFAAVARDGIAFLRDVPAVHATVLHVANLIGFVRETNYGRIFDVRSVAKPNNLAYTSLALPAHTDNPYRDPVPGLQLLHCLSTAGHGGESLFVDGLAIAEYLLAHEVEAFYALSRLPVLYRFQDAGTDLACERTILDLDAHGQFRAIYYNDRSIAPLPFTGLHLNAYYDAYRKLAALLRDPARSVLCRLEPGDLVVFDNTRILHGRTAFSANDGVRHLQGCYVDADALYSALAVLSRKESVE